MINEHKVIAEWIDHVNENGINLSKWEVDFMESITEQFEIFGSISVKQEETLERIYLNKTP